MKDYKVIVGENIKRIRQEKNMTQDALANACGHDTNSARSWVSKIESGARNTTTEEIGKIAYALGVEPSILFIDIEKHNYYGMLKRLNEHRNRINKYIELEDLKDGS